MNEIEQMYQECQKVLDEADCLYSHQQVMQAVEQLANKISQTLEESFPIVMSVMNGGLVPTGLLLPLLHFPLQQDYIHASRYKDKTRGGQLEWKNEPSLCLQQRTVLLVDDIHDEGVTLEAIRDYCVGKGAKSVYSAVLVDKKHNRKRAKSADFVGLQVPDRYVFGYGMDYKGLLRNAAGIYAVKGL